MLTVMGFFWIIRRLWYLIILVVQIVGIVDIITSRMSKNTKILWAVLVIIFPVLGTIAYFFLAREDRA